MLDALVNLVTQLAATQKPASVARVCDIHFSNDHHTSVCPSLQQSGVDEHPEAYAGNTYSRPPQQQDKALDREDGSQLLAFSARNDAIVIRGVHDVAIDTSAETTKLEGKLDALVNLVTQVATNQKPASIKRVCDICYSNDRHNSVYPYSHQSGVDEHPEAYAQFSARNDAIIIREVHDVATDTSAETRKLEGKLDALVNLVSQVAANQMSASVARVCGICYSNDQHTSVCPSSQQSGVDEHLEAYAANTYCRPP
ncbi:hypothetical protein Fmac_028681 [Flemingia macrophylla]|uniref:Uncharacterized protein n=1 Tax=Flemingia macrophylla TaxID=520843 RepID=A0ABD1L877_9FABA